MLQLIKKYRGNINIFYQYMISHIITLVVAIAFFSIAYMSIYDVLSNNVTRSSYEQLTQATSATEQQLHEIQNLVLHITTDNDFRSLTTLPSPLSSDDAIVDFNNYNSTLVRYDGISNAIDAFHIYLDTPNVVFAEGNLVLRKDIEFASPTDMAKTVPPEWEALLPTLQKNTYTYLPVTNYSFLANTNITTEYMAVIYPIDFYNNHYATICFFVSKGQLDQIFSYIDGASIFSAMLNSAGEIVYSHGSIDDELLSMVDFTNTYRTIEYKGENYVVSAVTPDGSDFKYVSVSSFEIVSDQLSSIRTSITIMLLVIIVVFLFLSFAFTYLNLRPINAIFNKMFPDRKLTVDILNSANKHIEAMVLDNSNYQEKILSHLPIIKSSLCERLILGNIASAIKLEEILSSYNILLNLEYVNLILLTLVGEKSTDNPISYNAIRIMLSEQLSEVFGDDILYCDTETNQIALIVSHNTKNDNEKTITTKLKKISAIIEKISEHKFMLYSVSCEVFSNVIDSPLYYRNLKVQSEYLIRKNIPCMILKDSKAEYDYYSYPLELETTLITNACSGNTEKVKINVEHIFLTLSRNIAPEDFNRGLSALRTTTYRTYRALKTQYPDYDFISESFLKNKLSSISETLGIQDIERTFVGLLTEMSRTVEHKEKSSMSSWMEQIKEYIKENYNNPMLSQSMIAEMNNISEPYLSRCFRQYTGETYSEYLAKVRMHNATDLLKNSDKNVNDIAALVGYNSPQVFRRTFKQFYGITPNEHRKAQKA